MIKKIINSRVDLALLVTRLIIGGIFVYTGWMKISDMAMTLSFFYTLHVPVFLVYIVSYGEFLGGILLILGLRTLFVSLFLSVIMVVAFCLTRTQGFQVFGLPLAMLSGLIAIAGCGAGKYSIKNDYK
jgi:putative oxidoreductase